MMLAMQTITRPSSYGVRANCVNGAEKLEFVISGAIRKCNCINNLMLMLCLQHATLLKMRLRHKRFHVNFFLKKKIQTASFLKNETPALLFSCELCKVFQPVTLVRTRFWYNPLKIPLKYHPFWSSEVNEAILEQIKVAE